MAFFPIAVVLIFVLMYLLRTKRTRMCRWRLQAGGDWRCVACGALASTGDGKQPRLCLRDQQ